MELADQPVDHHRLAPVRALLVDVGQVGSPGRQQPPRIVRRRLKGTAAQGQEHHQAEHVLRPELQQVPQLDALDHLGHLPLPIDRHPVARSGRPASPAPHAAMPALIDDCPRQRLTS